MALPSGKYRVTLSLPEDSFFWRWHGGKKLGDIRVTPTCELFDEPEVVVMLWAGDIVVLDHRCNRPRILPTGEARIFIRTSDGYGSWLSGWITYDPCWLRPHMVWEWWKSGPWFEFVGHDDPITSTDEFAFQ